MKKLISLLTLLAMLTMCIVPVSASDASISVYYEGDLKVNFTMALDESSTYSLDGVNAVSSNDSEATISIVYNGNNMGTFSVSAKEIYANYSVEDPDVLIISGTEDGALPGTEVTVSVFYSGKDYSNTIDGQIGQLASILVGTTDVDGYWEVEFVANESAQYDIYAGASHREALMKTVYVMEDRSSVIESIKTGDKATLKSIFGNAATLNGIIADMSILEGIEDTGSVGEILYGIREELTDKEDTLLYLNLACSMAVLKAKASASSMETVIGRLEEHAYALDNYSVYDENKTADISAAMAKRLANATDNGIEGFNKAFTDAVILGGVEGSATWADVAPFMELLNNATYAGNVYDVSVAVVGNSYATIEDLEKAVKKATTSSKPSGGSGGGGGGGASGVTTNKDTDDKFGIISGSELEEVTQPEKEEVAEKVLFTDVAESHWAFDGIHYLYWQEIVSGDDKGQFNPDNNVTRAEMIKMLCNTFGIEPANKASFDDVASTDWFYGYAGAAFKAGLVKGSDGKLNPNDLLTREDMAVLVYRFAQYAGVEFATSDVKFKDFDSISAYATDAVNALNTAGLVNGMGDGSYSPKGTSTRAQVATILYRYLTR
ncbi:MAG: S-layer homology domain-containing protein [Clostridia bacterium]|nr:S-layer homology domain-containing protein [Clostridia bacterium]